MGMGTAPAKIRIENLDATEKADREITLPFNPPEYSLSKGAQIAEIAIPGIDSPLLQFIRGTNETLTLNLFFDTTDKGTDVREETKRLYKLARIDRRTHALPRCSISWGKSGTIKGDKKSKFVGIVENINQNFILFKPDGTPLRAELEVTFREYRTLEEQIVELQSYTRTRIVKNGDTLSSIAAEEYNDPGEWRRIAEKNRIVNPRVLTPGQALEIPPME
jgi:nucleoid-associated protein YgaU